MIVSLSNRCCILGPLLKEISESTLIEFLKILGGGGARTDFHYFTWGGVDKSWGV